MYQLNNSVKLVDYDKWYQKAWASGFLKNIQAEYDVTPVRILRDDDDPNHVIVVLTAQSLKAFDNLLADPRIHEFVADKNNYLVETPKPVGRYTATEINDVNPEAKYGFHTQHRLVDYNQWFSIFKDSTFRKEIEEANGLRCVRILRETENQNNAVVIFQGPSQDAYDAMHNDPRVQERFNDQSIFVEPPRCVGRFTSVNL